MKQKSLVWIAVTFLVLIVAGGYYYYTTAGSSGNASQVQAADEATIQQAVARNGSLLLSVSGSGELVPASSIELSFPDDGELVELNVKVGDEVNEGEVLACLQIDQTPNELAAEIANAELAVVSAQQNLDQLYENAQIDAAQALTAVEEAQQALNDVKDVELEQALAQQAIYQAEQAVEEAEMQLYIVKSSPSQEAIDIAYASLLFKEKDLNDILDQIAKIENKIKSAPNKKVKDMLKQQLLNLKVQLTKQQIEYDNALYKYNTMGDPAETIDLAVAEAQLTTAQVKLAEAQKTWEELQAGPNAGDIAMAEAQLARSQAKWERLKDGPDPEEIALAEAELAKAQAKLALAQQGQLVLDLVAPIDGTVLSIKAAVSDRINNKETILTLADLSQSYVKVYLDESDLQNIQVGYPAEIVFDALPEKTLTGQVVEINPSLQDAGITQAVQALVQLDTRPVMLNKLPMGLNASVDIIAEQVENAVLVPIEALQQGAGGGYIVHVITEQGIEPRSVEVGLMDVTTVQITAGLQAGERIAIGGADLDQE